MKKSIITFLLLVVAVVFTNETTAQNFSGLDKSPMDAASYPSNWRVSDKLVKVTYSRPQLKGRSLTQLAPKGKVWRTGANEAAEITFYKDVTFGDKKVKAGTYSLFTIPGDDKWTVVLNTAKNVWGSYFYKQKEDVARVIAKVSKAKKTLEAFSITFSGQGEEATMYLGWGDVVISVPVKG
ncbi:conserved exported protein of unknown function [Tenacibaculum sp. 190130A14a]